MQTVKYVVLLLTFWAGALSSKAQSAAPLTNADQASVVVIKVKGVTCAMDLKTIAANVEKLDGVSSCKPLKEGAVSTFQVAYNPSKISEKEIHAAVENTEGCENPADRPYKVKL
jgi:copper chaperone CopZ